MKRLKINPILYKESKVRMRSWKAPFLIAVYVGVLGLIATLMLFNSIMDPYQYRFNSREVTTTYAVLSGIQFLLIAFIVPALTSSAISGERERQTLDLLLCTKLKPTSIILGKLLTSISQILLLILAALPVFSIVFLFGGISFKEIAQLFLYYMVLAITFGSIGMFFSTYVKKTTTATVLTYGVILFLMLGTLIISAFYLSIKARSNPNAYNMKVPIMYFNPGAGYVSLITEQFGVSPNIPGMGNSGGSAVSSSHSMPLWIVNIIINIVISAVLLFLASYKLNPVKKSKIKKLTTKKS